MRWSQRGRRGREKGKAEEEGRRGREKGGAALEMRRSGKREVKSGDGRARHPRAPRVRHPGSRASAQGRCPVHAGAGGECRTRSHVGHAGRGSHRRSLQGSALRPYPSRPCHRALQLQLTLSEQDAAQEQGDVGRAGHGVSWGLLGGLGPGLGRGGRVEGGWGGSGRWNEVQDAAQIGLFCRPGQRAKQGRLTGRGKSCIHFGSRLRTRYHAPRAVRAAPRRANMRARGERFHLSTPRQPDRRGCRSAPHLLRVLEPSCLGPSHDMLGRTEGVRAGRCQGRCKSISARHPARSSAAPPARAPPPPQAPGPPAGAGGGPCQQQQQHAVALSPSR